MACGCSEITGDLDRVIAIDVLSSLTPTVEEQDTVRLLARAVDAAGDVVEDAPIVWEVVDTPPVGFTVDSATGLVQAFAPGSGRVQARVETLASGLIRVTVTPAPDSVSAAVAEDTLALGQAASPPVSAAVWDLTTSPGEQLALAGKPVHFELVDPQPGTAAAAAVFLTPGDTVPGADPHHVAATTEADGSAGIVVRRVTGAAQPDSAIMHAYALTARGDTVPGSPVRLVVQIEN